MNVIPKTIADQLGSLADPWAEVHGNIVYIAGTPAAKTTRALDTFGPTTDTTDLDATTLKHGLMSKLDKIKLDAVNLASITDGDMLKVTYDPTNINASAFDLSNHTGTLATSQYADSSVTLAKMANTATGTILGRVTGGTGVVEYLTASQVRTLLGVEAGATADQTGAEIKALYEAEADTNAFTDAEQAKLAAISGTNTGDQDLSGYSLTSHNHTGVYAHVLGADDNYVTDAEKTKLSNLSGTNTGDQDLSGYSLTSHNHTGVYAPVLGADDNYVTDAEKTKLSNLSGTNTGDQDLSGYSLTSHNHSGVYQPVDAQLTDLAGLSYAGNALKVIRVNAGETAFEVATPAGGGDALVANTLDQFADVTQTGGATLAISASTTLSGGTHSGTNTGDQDLSGYSLTSHNHTGVYAPVLGTDDNYVTDAEKTKLGNLSGTNTGDQDLSGYSLTSHNHSGVYQPVDTQLTDLAGLSYAGNTLKVVRVNAGETAFELATLSTGGDVSKVGTPANNQVGVWTGDGTIEGDANLTFDTSDDTLTAGILNATSLTASQIVGTNADKDLVSLAVATYPSLAELAYVKGVTSAIQTQLDAKASKAPDINAQTGTSYTLVLGDAGKRVTMENAATSTLTVPLNSSVAYAVGTQITGNRLGAGTLEIVATGGVTILPIRGSFVPRYGKWELTKLATNTWVLDTSGPFSIAAEYLVVGGGGGGGGNSSGGWQGGGGGAGGYRTGTTVLLDQSYPIIIGAGGAGGTSAASGSSGSNSSFNSIIGTGGGYGGGAISNGGGADGGSGGSGGGGAGKIGVSTGGAGNAGSFSPVEGYAGAGNSGSTNNPGCGGGSSSAATAGAPSTAGAGTSNSISGSAVTYGVGGGISTGTAGTANRGNGGAGGSGASGNGGAGGTGEVTVKYLGEARFTGGTITSSGGYTIHTFTSSGTLAPA
jgi:hypothetical protein